ncbi:cupin domain-containing protein [Streptomyces sp. NRRL F-5126]|uniref:cupin domain-containing protein n=1 Tax=Streptomyces sp. NRRL F-5126 TaxID=1463857 RepID=UPI00068E34B4|nr:cupin domain-containing protein [Streptomyces sp. NRRL F-5126]
MWGLSHTPQQRRIEVVTEVFGGIRDGITWQPYIQPGRDAVDVHWLYTAQDTGPDGAEAYIARFRPGAHGDLHEHLGYELMVVLDGELINDNGDQYLPGTIVVERPHSIHRVTSPGGCELLVVREKRTVPLPPGATPDDGLALTAVRKPVALDPVAPQATA